MKKRSINMVQVWIICGRNEHLKYDYCHISVIQFDQRKWHKQRAHEQHQRMYVQQPLSFIHCILSSSRLSMELRKNINKNKWIESPKKRNFKRKRTEPKSLQCKLHKLGNAPQQRQYHSEIAHTWSLYIRFIVVVAVFWFRWRFFFTSNYFIITFIYYSYRC